MGSKIFLKKIEIFHETGKRRKGEEKKEIDRACAAIPWQEVARQKIALFTKELFHVKKNDKNSL